MEITPFTGPIPGQSLTSEPGNVPWEKPSALSDPMDVLEMYMEKLNDKEVMDDVIDMLDIGIPVDIVSASLLTKGVLEGQHTVDVKLLLRPLVSIHIKALADIVGVDYKMSMDDYEDKDAMRKEKRKKILAAKLAQRVGVIPEGKADAGEEIVMEVEKQLDEPQEEVQQEQPAEEPAGLMARGQ